VKAGRNVSSYWRDIFLQASGNTIAQAIGILGIPLLARLYTPQDFAVQNIFLQLVMFFSGVMTWRYEYFFQMLRSEQQARSLLLGVAKLGFVTGVILTFIMYFFSAEIAKVLSLQSGEKWLVIAPLSAFFVSIALAFQHNAQREGSYKISALSEVFGKSSYVISGALLAFVSGSGLVLTTLFSALGKIASIVLYSKTLFGTRAKSSACTSSPLKEHAHGAHALVVSHLLVTMSSAAPIFFISAAYGAEVLGQFSMVLATIFLPSGLIGAAIGQVFYQRAASHHLEPMLLRSLWRLTVRRLAIFGIPIYLGAAILAPYLYPLVLGGQWHDAGAYAQLLAIGALCAFISTPLDRISLVLRFNFYMPLLHVLRLVLTVGVILIAKYYGLIFRDFLILYVAQVSAVYLLDLIFARILIAMAIEKSAATLGKEKEGL